MTELNDIISTNIQALRKHLGLTQSAFAEKLNYTDKAVSKWERGESLPDIAVLKEISDLFGVTVDWLITSHDGEKAVITDKSANRRRIVMLAILGVWLIAVTSFVTGVTVTHSAGKFWLAFVAALPLSFIILIVFNSIWGRPRVNSLYISGLLWTAMAFIYLLLLCLGQNLWMIFLIGLPLQAGVIIWHLMLKK